MNTVRVVSVGLIGLGVVGSEVARALEDWGAFACPVDTRLHLARVLVKDLKKPRAISLPASLISADPRDVVDAPDIDIIVEVMGGEEPARTYISRALAQRKHVVTANKEVMAKFGTELLDQASEHRVQLLFEASVAAGIPIVGPLRKDLRANRIRSIRGIINGTSNYILTRMATDGLDFGQALKEAQSKGYAEPNPTNDVEGIDAAYKLAILATLAFHTRVHASDVYYEGITHLTARDFRYAQELGYVIKPLAIGQCNGADVQVRVHPALVPSIHAISKVDGVFNAVELVGDLVGPVLFHGLGAGPRPTTSAIIGDVLEVARNISNEIALFPSLPTQQCCRLSPIDEIDTKYYVRMSVPERAGVLAQIAHVLAEHQISIASVIQKERDEEMGTAEIVVMTHPAVEASMQRAVRDMAALDEVEIGTVVRVEQGLALA